MKFIAAILVVAAASTMAFGYSFDQVDVEYWTGTGESSSMMVLDFGGGNNYAFGYRFDGVKTGYDMIADITAASGSTFTFTPVYKEDGVTLRFDLFETEGGDMTIKGKRYSFGSIVEEIVYKGHKIFDDYYGTGESIAYFVSGYPDWTNYVYDEDTEEYVPVPMPGNLIGDGENWETLGFGSSGRILSDGWWDGYTQVDAEGNFSAPVTPLETPEPATLVMLGVGSFFMFRKKSKCA